MTTTPHPADPHADTIRAMIAGSDDYTVSIPAGASMNAYDHMPAGIMGGSPWVDVIDYPAAGTVTRATLDALGSDVPPVYPIVPAGRYRAAMSSTDVPDDIRADVTDTPDGPIVFGWLEVDDDGSSFTADTATPDDGPDPSDVDGDPVRTVTVRTRYRGPVTPRPGPLARNGAVIIVTGPNPSTGRPARRTVPYDHGARDAHAAAVATWAADAADMPGAVVAYRDGNDAGSRRAYTVTGR